jgi:hypothetical protein
MADEEDAMQRPLNELHKIIDSSNLKASTERKPN